MVKLIQILVLFFTLNLTANQDVFTDKEKNWIKNNTIKVGVEQWEPVVNINENNDVDPYVSLVIVGNLIAIIAADEISKDMKEEISTEIEKTLNIDKDDLWFVLGEVNKLKETARNLMRQLN